MLRVAYNRAGSANTELLVIYTMYINFHQLLYK